MKSRERCREIEPELTALQQGELAADRRVEVEAHLADCPACRAAAGEIRSVFTLAGTIEDLVPSMRFKRKLASAMSGSAVSRPLAESLLFRIRSGAAFLVHRMRTSGRFRLAAISVVVHTVLLLVVSLVVLPQMAQKGTARVWIDSAATDGLSDEPVQPETTEGPIGPGISIPPAHPPLRETVALRTPTTPELDPSMDLLPPDRPLVYRPLAGLFGGRLLDAEVRERRLASLGLDAPAVMRSIHEALRWLAARQTPDGSWDPVERNPAYRTGVTATALLAFLADGHSLTHGFDEWRDVVRRGVAQMIDSQQAEGACRGLVGPAEGHYTYNHAMATLALVEVWCLDHRRLPPAESRRLRKAVGMAVDFIVKSQMPKGGWRYVLPDGASEATNTSVAILQVIALSAARNAGFEVPSKTLEGFTTWLKGVTGENGVVGYMRPGDRDGDPRTLTAGALFLEELLGLAAPLRDRQADEVRRNLKDLGGPVATDGLLRFYAVSAFRLRGENALGRLAPGLLAAQRADGSFESSGDRHAVHAGDVFLTALNVLTLTSAYRWQS